MINALNGTEYWNVSLPYHYVDASPVTVDLDRKRGKEITLAIRNFFKPNDFFSHDKNLYYYTNV